MEATAYVVNAESNDILYIVSGPSEDAVQDYIETKFGAYIFDEWQVCWSKFDELHETGDTEEIEINENGEKV